jgi:hypothetical protein
MRLREAGLLNIQDFRDFHFSDTMSVLGYNSPDNRHFSCDTYLAG